MTTPTDKPPGVTAGQKFFFLLVFMLSAAVNTGISLSVWWAGPKTSWFMSLWMGLNLLWWVGFAALVYDFNATMSKTLDKPPEGG